MVSKPIDGKPASHANGGTIGFTMSSREQVDAWHKAGVANGGTSIEDPPGVRQGAAGQMYLAYLRDPDGNKAGRGFIACRLPELSHGKTRRVALSGRPFHVHCALIQFSDPVTLTDTSEKEIRTGFPSAVPR